VCGNKQARPTSVIIGELALQVDKNLKLDTIQLA
jgi:hypothetical protein